MASPLTDAREALAEVLRAALPSWSVYAFPPRNVTLPAAIVGLGAGVPGTVAGTYLADYRIVVCSTGGDNEGSLATLEDGLTTIAAAYRAAYGNKPRYSDPGWDEPGRTTIAGATVLCAVMEVQIPIRATPAVRTLRQKD